MKEFNTSKEFFSFIMNFEGELIIKHNIVYYNGDTIAIFKQHN